MTDLDRLIDHCESDLQRALLEAGRTVDDGTARRRTQVLVALGVGTAVATTSKASFAAAVWKAAVWKKALLGSVVACTGFTGVVVYRTATNEQLPAITAQPDFAGSFAATEARFQGVVSTDALVVPEEALFSEQLVEAAADTESPSIAEANVEEPALVRKPRSVKPARDEGGLRDEIALLDSARAAVNVGSPRMALTHLDDYSTRFPKGRLRLEAEVLRVQALAAAGQRQEASRRAQRILGRSPNSVVAARLRRYVIE